MKKKNLTLASLTLLTLLLAGCGAPKEYGSEEERSSERSGQYHVDIVDLPDGREVTCVRVRYNTVSCDWDNAE